MLFLRGMVLPTWRLCRGELRNVHAVTLALRLHVLSLQLLLLLLAAAFACVLKLFLIVMLLLLALMMCWVVALVAMRIPEVTVNIHGRHAAAVEADASHRTLSSTSHGTTDGQR